jgi:uncharacterized protein YecT (DUF1311 family)
MKYLFLVVSLFVRTIVFSQSSDAPREVTPEIEKKIRKEVEKAALDFQRKLKEANDPQLDIEFSVDTFRIERYQEKYMAYDYSTSGMVTVTYFAEHQYDSLMNKYYKKLLSLLKSNDKQVLIQAQKAWISFRDSESKLIDTVSKDEYSGGGTIQLLIDASSYLSLVKNRLIEIFDHLDRIAGEH